MKMRPNSKGIKEATYVLVALIGELTAVFLLSLPQDRDTVNAMSTLSIVVMIGFLYSIADRWLSVVVADVLAFLEFIMVAYLIKTLHIRGIWNLKVIAIGTILALVNITLSKYLSVYWNTRAQIPKV